MLACTEPEHVTAAEFKREYAAIEQLHTMKSVTYLGQKDGRAYIRISKMSLYDSKKWVDSIIYVELAELDSAFLNALPLETAAGNPPSLWQ
ncbi:MAG TPA: hypothetical protein PL131_07205 [Methylotenera sp.]|nr:hypothetical protein [Methylotenera sp.]HPH05647.1 hypothetical protein [Methylotenera sp.]HPN01327.1 hypothetical protein [Methylotenera sp.]